VNFVQVFLRERFLTEGGFGFDADVAALIALA
jgi:hypothetical protein